jgi:glycosyltransferase involved in cell wall biosynthesis
MSENSRTSPLVSFCFTTYKRGPVLKKTLESIRRQTFSDYEVIVSDNDPESSGRSFVESMGDPRFKYFPNGENLGMKPSFNKSLERSSGEYIVMIADDDPVYYDMLQTLMDLKAKYPGYGMYMGGCDWFCEDKQVAKMNNMRVGTNSCISSEHNLEEVFTLAPAEFIHSLLKFTIFKHYLWSTCIVKREILVRMGGIPDYGTPFLGDFAYMSVSGSEGCVLINKALGCQTMHRENFGRNQDEQLPVLAKRFPVYMTEKLSGLAGWESLKNEIMWFLSLWLIEHLTFLFRYKKANNLPLQSLQDAEKEVFRNDFMKKYKFKYFLKKNFRGLHDLLLKIKKSVSRG